MGHRTDEIIRVGGVDELLDRGIAADEEGDIELAERILDEAGGRIGENHPRVLHLAGRVAWAHGDIERATGFFQQACDRKPDRAEIYLDCARCLQLMGEDGHAEEQVRAALALPGLEPMLEGDARLLLSRIRLDDDDAEEALEELEAIPEELKQQAIYLSALADVLVELDRGSEALRCLDRAVEAEPDDPDYHYQRGLTQQAQGQVEAGAQSLVRVLELEAQLVTARAQADVDAQHPRAGEARLERAAAAVSAIAAIEAAGGQARYVSVDLRDGAAVRAALEGIDRVDVLLHAAGLEISRRVADKSPEEFDLVFGVKARGWHHLLSAIGDRPLRSAVVFSSIAGRFGNVGQTDYAAANEVLNRFGWWLRSRWPSVHVTTVNWGPWAGIGMADAAIMDALRARGIMPVAPEAGIRFFMDELVYGDGASEVIAGDGPWRAADVPPVEHGFDLHAL
ncbi:MAG: SDR family NAD(P)-dependent oxidoreductase, partial [Myxococcales bacterium]|nr:SDR family NAD(P)-dependent oxidoreductase [Myxococcales bacterium]